MREIGPTYYFAPPRVLEVLPTQVMIRMEDASAIKRRMFHYFMRVARTSVGDCWISSLWASAIDRFMHSATYWSMPLRNSLGMSRVRIAYTAGEAIGPDLFTFYRSLGINLKQLYGSTETSVFVCVQENGGVKADTVGPPVKGVEIKLTDAGEIPYSLARAVSGVLQSTRGYMEAKDGDGWFLHRGRRLLRPRRSSENHRSREGCRQTIGRHTVRTEVHREQAEVFPDDQELWRSATSVRWSPRSSTSIWKPSETGRASQLAVCRLHRSGGKARGSHVGARSRRQSQRRSCQRSDARQCSDSSLYRAAQGV